MSSRNNGKGRGLGYELWLGRSALPPDLGAPWLPFLGEVKVERGTAALDSASAEFARSLEGLFGTGPEAGPGSIIAA